MMTSNKQILESWQITQDATLFNSKEEEVPVVELMKEAQVVILKEVVKRQWQNLQNRETSKFPVKLKSTGDIVLELIKEIES